LLWAGLGPEFAEKSIMKWLKKVQEKKVTGPDEIFLGFPMATKDTYYVEANPMDLSMGKIGVLINRIKEVVFLSVGICILVAKSLGAFFFDNLMQFWDVVMNDPFEGTADIIIDTAIYLGPFALLILFAVMPMFWIGEDMQIYRVDNLQDPHRVGMYLRTGLLSKVLGFFGIVLAYDTASQWAQQAGYDGLDLYIQTFVQFGLILFACSAAPFIVAVIYLIKYHEIWVNNIRIKASAFLPCGTMEIRTVPPSELENLTHPEKLKENNSDKLLNFLKTPTGTAVLIVALILGVLGCFFMGFIFTGVWSQPIYKP
jgi:hypothetical protein